MLCPTGASQIVISTLEFVYTSFSSPTENDIGDYITSLISIKFIKQIFGPHGQIPRNKIIPELETIHTYKSVPRRKLGLILERRVDRRIRSKREKYILPSVDQDAIHFLSSSLRLAICEMKLISGKSPSER